MYKVYERLRNERGMTDYQVSQETGISTATLSSWKTGRYTPKVDKLLKIAKLFGVTVSDLIVEEPDAVPKA